MKATKIMSIVGIVMAGLSFIFIGMFDNIYEYESSIGWGIIADLYLLAFSIVALVQSRKLTA